MELFAEIAERYADFARYAHDDSPCFEAWALAVADDPEVQAWLGELPVIKQQPNLVFAAARWHGVPAPEEYDVLRAALLDDDGAIRETIMTRSTQTNEAGRLATLTPAFGLIEGPLALIEVGASAGLCLYPDRYDYDWPPLGSLTGSGGPTLRAEAAGAVPIPKAQPRVAWRGGVDLNPLDVTDPDQMAWLTTLIWPEHDDRRRQLETAIDVARAEPPYLIRGDLAAELPALVEEAGRHGTPVVFHSAVIAYLDEPRRRAFYDQLTDLVTGRACRWVSNEAPQVLPEITRTGPAMPAETARFVLGLDGQAVAWTQAHGRAITWL